MSDDKPTWREAPVPALATEKTDRRQIECDSCHAIGTIVYRSGRWHMTAHNAPCGLACLAGKNGQFLRPLGADDEPTVHGRFSCPRCNPKIVVIHYLRRPDWQKGGKALPKSTRLTLAQMRAKVRELKAEGWEFEVRDIVTGEKVET